MYGFSASVFTRDLGRALRIAKGVERGAVHVNGMTVHDGTRLPHGGEFCLSCSWLPYCTWEVVVWAMLMLV